MDADFDETRHKTDVRRTGGWTRKLVIPCYTAHTVLVCCAFLLIMCVSLYVIAYRNKIKSAKAEIGLREAVRLTDELARREAEFFSLLEDERIKAKKIGDEVAKAYEVKIRYFEEKTAEFAHRIDELEAIRDDLSNKIDSTIAAPGADGEVLSAVFNQEAVGGPSQGDYLDWIYTMLETDIGEQEESYNGMHEYVFSSSLNEKGLHFALARGVKRENIPTIWPVTGRITSWYGKRQNPFGGGGQEGHNAIDIAVSNGTPVMAAGSGVVKHAGMMGSYGYLVIIDHGSGLESYYGHNSRVIVKVGQQVKRGHIISLSGSTGRSTGPHVHFEIRFDNKHKNPLDFVSI